MYARALVTGELEAANKTKYNSTGRTKEEAFASIENAEPVYLQQADVDRLTEKIEKYSKRLEEVQRLGVRESEKKLLEGQINKLKEKKKLSLLRKEKQFLESLGEE